ncbi:MAG: hypothetical protein XD78_1904 [Desulfotomaculum sp. 46_296]|nr:MAG: hypothetical protein XD78_1904 [Desulfotomaculum sp. 46_296]
MFNMQNSYEKATAGLESLVADLAKKGQARRDKLQSNLQILTEEEASLKNEVSLKTQLLVAAEVEESPADQDRFNKELVKLRRQLEDVSSKTQAYKSALDLPILNSAETMKLKAAALKVREARLVKVHDVATRQTEIVRLLKELNEENSRLVEEKFLLEQPREASVAKAVMGFVDSELASSKFENRSGAFQFAFEAWLNS